MWDDNPALDFYKCRENLCSISLNWAQNHNFFHAEAQTWRNADFARVQIEKNWLQNSSIFHLASFYSPKGLFQTDIIESDALSPKQNNQL